MFEKLASNTYASTRREYIDDREYIVAPVTMIVAGVLNGTKGALLYPADELKRNPSDWNGMPLTLGHPTNSSGEHTTARSPSVFKKFALGTLYNVHFVGNKLTGEAWFDVGLVKRRSPTLLSKLNSDQPIELSTGLFMDTTAAKGTFNNRPYTAIARNYRPDHLAILLDVKGACSLKDGCGVLAGSFVPFPTLAWNHFMKNVKDDPDFLPLPIMNFEPSSTSPKASKPAANCKCSDPDMLTMPLIDFAAMASERDEDRRAGF